MKKNVDEVINRDPALKKKIVICCCRDVFAMLLRTLPLNVGGGCVQSTEYSRLIFSQKSH